MAMIHVVVDEKPLEVESGKTILQVCRENGIEIPTLCAVEGLSKLGACRLCLVEVQGIPKLLPACTTPIAANQTIHTQSEKLSRYRRMIMELFFSERNHVCAVCISNGACKLQDMGYQVGMDHVRFPYLFLKCKVDTSHERFVLDHNRCIMCHTCIRVCNEVEGAHVFGTRGRGARVRVITNFNEPWGDAFNCTSCGKCVQACPTGALWPKDATMGMIKKKPEMISELVERREVWK
jgi:bidirectional [NiFe] hydrogenase diaphorase subunit